MASISDLQLIFNRYISGDHNLVGQATKNKQTEKKNTRPMPGCDRNENILSCVLKIFLKVETQSKTHICCF